MSQVSGGSASMNEVIAQRRDDLAAAAQRSAAKNHPRSMVLLALMVLTLAVLWFSVSYKRHADAKDQLETLTDKANATMREAAKLKLYRELKAEKDRDSGGAAAGSWLGQLEAFGPAVGLTKPLTVPSTRTDRPAGKPTRTTATYTIRDENLGAMLAWVDKATTEVPGVEGTSMLVKPEAEVWMMTVVLVRYERTE